MKRHVNIDRSKGADVVLRITHATEESIERYTFDRFDEDGISEFIAEHVGEQLHELNGCPIFMEIVGWASGDFGEQDDEYSELGYFGLDEDEWKFEICHLDQEEE